MEGIYWVPFSSEIDKSILVEVGNDGDGAPMYIARAHHADDLIPGKLLTGSQYSNHCHISYNGQEFSKNSFEVLINTGFSWIPASDGNVPHHAVVGGRTSSGESLYIGRAPHCGILTPGRIHKLSKCMFLPFGWKEFSYSSYEVLVKKTEIMVAPIGDSLKWVWFSPDIDESDLVHAGDHPTGSLFIARAHHAGDLIPGKYVSNNPAGNFCHIAYGGQEIVKDQFEVLINTGFKWISESNGYVPENSVVGGQSMSGETVYIGRTMHNGQNTPGKICRRSKCIYIPFGNEISYKEYDVLVQILQPQPVSNYRSSVEWVSVGKGRPWPTNAVAAGIYREFGNCFTQYIARRRHGNNVVIGYAYNYYDGPIFYFGWHDKEISYRDFDVLVEHTAVFPKETL
ncbi:unnamed protein product [Chironomus riparius]|uniref:Uncharacterized protein n=1 Tax=Chironomus riparius TaxID=315576 RepID=A0A9N9S6T3_9DIPT|nr:unnamed protein product [Chironomus riparius]